MPRLLAELFDEPVARRGLLVGTVALVAAAFDPKVWGPALPSVQAALRERPELEAVVMLLSVVGAALLLLGGAAGDTFRARRIILAGLTAELLASVVSLLFPSGALVRREPVRRWTAAAFIVPVSIALVATSYRGIARATAIGLAYGAYGGAGGAAPMLLQVIPDQRAPAFVASIAACAVALWFCRNRVSELTRPELPERPYVVATAVWAFGVISLTVGLTWVGGGFDNPLRWAMVLLGLAVLAFALARERRRRRTGAAPVSIERRPVAVAIFAGIVLAIAQTIPMLALPLYFHLVLGYGPLASLAALAPLFAALVLAGPVAGYLLGRFPPRTLVGIGVVAVGLANLLLWWTAKPSQGYLAFVLPCALIGAGFVIATTVRTAIIFASMPRGLPATAAALNESSIAIGTRIGIVLATAIVAQAALDAYTVSVAGLPPDQARQAIAGFQDLLTAVGTPSFNQVATGVGQADFGPYLDAYATGLRAAFGLGGIVAVIGGAIAWLALDRRDSVEDGLRASG